MGALCGRSSSTPLLSNSPPVTVGAGETTPLRTPADPTDSPMAAAAPTARPEGVVDQRRVCPVGDFPEGSSRLIKAGDGRNIAVFHHNGAFFAMDNACYHHGGPLQPGKITRMGGHVCVKCPWHGYLLDIENGEGVYMGLGPDMKTQEVRSKGPKQRVHRTVVEAGIVYVLVDTHGTWDSDEYALMAIANPDVVGSGASGGGSFAGIHSNSSDMRSGEVLRKKSGSMGPPAPKLAKGPPSRVVRCVRVIDETPSVKTFVWEVAVDRPKFTTASAMKPSKGPEGGLEGIQAIPGQYATFEVPLHGEAAPLVRRTWTISSTPGHPTTQSPLQFTTTVRRKEGGAGSTWLHENVHAESTGPTLNLVEVGGRFGCYFPTPELADVGGKILMLCAGVGITPMLAMLRGLFCPRPDGQAGPSLPHKLALDIVLVYSERRAVDLVCRQELQGFATDDSASGPHSVRVHFTVTGPEVHPVWDGEVGRITGDALSRWVEDVAKRVVFMCGPETFMESLRPQLVAQGVPATRIHVEAFDF